MKKVLIILLIIVAIGLIGKAVVNMVIDSRASSTVDDALKMMESKYSGEIIP